MSLLARALLTGLYWALGSFPQASAESSCFAPHPVLSANAKMDCESGSLGGWRLPVSWERPAMVTAAQVHGSASKDAIIGGPWKVHLDFSFPDPKPFGIPYNFQGITLTWHDSAGAHDVSLDWTNDCHGPGRAMFPGGQWADSIELPGTEDFETLPDLQIQLWGSRN